MNAKYNPCGKHGSEKTPFKGDASEPASSHGFRNGNKMKELRAFLISRPFLIFTAVTGALFIASGNEVSGAVFFVLLMSALLVLCDDLMTVLMPLLTVSIMVLQCYDSFSVFIKFIWLAVIPIGALIFHFIYYRGKFRIGTTFWGLIAVSVAVTFGGIGLIPASEYFAGVALFYIAALGFGMAFLYLLIKSQHKEKRDYDLQQKFIDIMYIMGIVAVVQLGVIFAECLIQDGSVFFDNLNITDPTMFYDGMKLSDIVAEYTENGLFNFKTTYFVYRMQPGNNISTFLLLALPFPYYLAVKKNKLHMVTVFVFLAALILTKSRGGALCGIALFIICSIVAAVYAKGWGWKLTFGLFAAAVAAASVYYAVKRGININPEVLVTSDEARVKLIYRSFEDFKSSPIFGKGIASRANQDLYGGKDGTLIWYHMMIPQIIGSMGSIGIIAYLIQFVGRVYVTVKKFSPFVVTLALSYAGLLMMSQVNPGEFCPIPYGLIAVVIFILIENEPDRIKKPKMCAVKSD